ncbi:MAG: glycerol-3-phosphate 1-O-acyltransferase PlsB [Pseudomonadota bacterium]
MRVLSHLGYWLAWLLFRPLLALVKFRVAPGDLHEQLKLDLNKPICFVLPQRSWIDLFALDKVCRSLGLPTPQRTGLSLPSAGRAGCVYLPALLETRVRHTPLTQVLVTAAGDPEFDIQIVPVSIFWGRDPGSEQSLFKLVFADNPQAGAVRKLFIMLVNARNMLANFAQPIGFRSYVAQEAEPNRAVKKMIRAVHFHFLRARTAVLGPELPPRRLMIEQVVASRLVRRCIEEEAKAKSKTIEQTAKRARRLADEIAAGYSSAAINFVERLLSIFVWEKVFKGIDVRGLDSIRELAQSHEIIYLPSHRSHADYLLLSYILYHRGMVPPHIAAGINLNMPVVGGLLRRCGAFFMRRKFSGDPLYTAIFRSYVDALVARGYAIEFFPEGGRSRTGRLLAPKTGLLSMVVESALRQRTRPVALVPIYIGYDKVWEVGSYFKELKGAKKEKESVEGLLKATKILGKSHGKAYLNFGEPLLLHPYADAELPGWREAFMPGTDTRPNGYSMFVRTLAEENARRINAAAVVNPCSLAATALLASPRGAASEDEIVEQIGHLAWLLKGEPYSEQMQIPDANPRAVLEWAMPVSRIVRVPHEWGGLVGAADRDAVLLTYNRNNIQHLFAIPSFIANLFRTRAKLSEEAIVMGCRALYPFLRTEYFLRWPIDEIEPVVRRWVAVMTNIGLLRREGEDLWRPDVTAHAYSTLAMLGRILGETLERYGMTALLLADEYRNNADLGREKFEKDCRLLAERMAVLTGREAPEFFDPALFKGYLNTLIGIGLVRVDANSKLVVDARIERIAERSLELLSDESRQTLLQLLSRRHAAAVPPAGSIPS